MKAINKIKGFINNFYSGDLTFYFKIVLLQILIMILAYCLITYGGALVVSWVMHYSYAVSLDKVVGYISIKPIYLNEVLPQYCKFFGIKKTDPKLIGAISNAINPYVIAWIDRLSLLGIVATPFFVIFKIGKFYEWMHTFILFGYRTINKFFGFIVTIAACVPVLYPLILIASTSYILFAYIMYAFFMITFPLVFIVETIIRIFLDIKNFIVATINSFKDYNICSSSFVTG